MPDMEKVIKGLENCTDIFKKCEDGCPYYNRIELPECNQLKKDALVLLKELEKKQITLHKKHVLTLKRNDEFTMRKLYESVCETLLDEGELFIARTDDHEKVDFVFYVAEGR